MPKFISNNKVYYTPVEYVLSKVGGTYKMPLLWRLKDQGKRFSELKNSFERISDRMLSKSLKELVDDQFLAKKVFAEIPVRVEYHITEKGKRAIPIISSLRDYGFQLINEDGIQIEP
ncbi:transcriptional regulator [Muricauda sp. JGD-17]|uniref:Transcriptional regulator n=1 Tax=Flagellimonas ochracea TaxID=2696472 RepID=A0A964TBC9_9FLAO|nr:helix-turn-helix domain-containing protein [Allomuricauda ochracea]NAY90903.1 transcriptional regulator [Allomuricauda ochracea]